MGESGATRWSMILGAARGDGPARALFARRYEPVIRAYLGARWRGTALAAEIDDAVQDVFLDCFRDDGALARVDPERSGGFHAFLWGVTRNVSLRVERSRARQRGRPGQEAFDADGVPAEEVGLSTVFDRAWAQSILAQAAARQQEEAPARGEDAVRRVELLQLRFRDGLPIRDIAARWGADPAVVHREYAKARREFEGALKDVVAEHHPRSPAEVLAECRRLLEIVG